MLQGPGFCPEQGADSAPATWLAAPQRPPVPGGRAVQRVPSEAHTGACTRSMPPMCPAVALPRVHARPCAAQRSTLNAQCSLSHERSCTMHNGMPTFTGRVSPAQGVAALAQRVCAGSKRCLRNSYARVEVSSGLKAALTGLGNQQCPLDSRRRQGVRMHGQVPSRTAPSPRPETARLVRSTLS